MVGSWRPAPVIGTEAPPEHNMKKCLLILWRAAIACVIVSAAVAAYLMVVGIPAPLVRRYLDEVERRQTINVTVDRVRWRPWHRVIARNVHVSTPAGVLTADAETVTAAFEASRDVASEWRLIQCLVSECRVNIAGEKEQPPATVRLPVADMTRLPDGNMRFNVSAWPADGFHCTIDAELSGISRGAEQTTPSASWERFNEGARRTYEALRSLDGLRDKGFLPDSLDARVMLDAGRSTPPGIRAWAFLEGGPMRVRDLQISRCSAALRWTNGLARVDSIRAVGPDANLCVEGRGTIGTKAWDVAGDLRVRGPAEDIVAAWLPAVNRLATARLSGPLLADLSFGPAPVQTVASNISGRVTCATLKCGGAELADVVLGFRRNGAVVDITDASASVLGDGPARYVNGRGSLVLGGSYKLHLASDAEPRRLAAFLPTNIAPLVASFEVAGVSRTELQLLRTAAPATNLTASGSFHAAGLTRNQIPADLMHADLAYSNGTLRVDNLAIVRKDGQLTGRFAYRSAEDLLSIEGRSTAPVLSMARFIEPGLEKTLSTYRFEGPATVEFGGSVGLGNNPARDLRIRIDGRAVGWRWFLAENAVLDLSIGEKATLLENLRARWCGGDVSGSLRFEKAAQTNEPGLCRLDLSVKEADMATVVGIFHDLEDRRAYEGALSGHVVLAGEMGPGFSDTATGSGRVDIRNGYILSIPLFGGLSKYLSLLVPGLGYASQRDLRGSFKIRDGRLETDDAELLGRAITIRGKGSYAFEKNIINGRVQVNFLKEGLTANVMRLITSPLTKALEFEATGTTKEPRWRPVNTPKRLLKFFSENLGKLVPPGPDRETSRTPPEEKVRFD